MNQSEIIKSALAKALEHFKNGDMENAEEIYRQILRIEDCQEALEMGSLVLKNNKPEEAKAWAIKALAKDNNFRLYNNLGLIHGALNEREDAIKNFETAITMNPDEAYLYTNLALELKKSGDYDRTFAILDKVIKDHPHCEHVYFNYGAIVHELGQLDKAVKLYQQALHINNDFPICHYNLSACYFLLDDWEKAWIEYEWRWKHFTRFNRKEGTYWNGQSLKGKTIVLYCEQGIGDAIMGARYIPMVKERGGRVVLEVVPPLVNLMKSCSGVDIINSDEPFDYHCSLLTLPGLFGTRPDNIPYSPRYLQPVELGDTDWKGYDKFKIGIAWAGNPVHPNDRNRSIKLAHFEKLMLPNVQLFNFQYDVRPHAYQNEVIDYTEGANIKLVDLRAHMHDFNCTAKMLEKMDLVVCADTAVAHTSGNLNINTLLCLPKICDWRWGLHSDRTGWYPSVRIFRGDWDSVFERVVKEINFH